MYEEHPTFIQPENEGIKVWRYMDFTKFVSLIDSRSLYFTRADNFEDPFEGSWPIANIAARVHVPENLSQEEKENYLKGLPGLSGFFKELPRYVTINSWHMNNHESVAMWKLYLKSDEGIAVQSTYAKLKNSFVDEESVYLGKVNYLDYDIETMNADNMFRPFVHKRMSFAHEQEVRALVIKLPPVEAAFNTSFETIKHGLSININIEILIESIYVSPSAPSWFADLVKTVIKKYDFNFDVLQSNLNKDPMF